MRAAVLVMIGWAFVCCGGRSYADEAYSDGFEDSGVGAFWTPVQINGTSQISSAAAHTGAQSLRMARTTSGQLTLQMNHTFSEPQFGTVSVWFYGNSTGYYSYLILGNSLQNRTSSIGVQDWDSSHYYYHALNDSGGAASVVRSSGWHLYTMSVTPTNQVIAIDGQIVYSGFNAIGFNTVTLHTSGPGGSASYYFDDFSFAPSPVDGVEITSLRGNGSLSWSCSSGLADSLFSVEWAPNLTSEWHSAWGGLSGMTVTGETVTVDVPMFFKVKAFADQLIPFTLNRQFTYAVSNAVGNVFTQRMAVLNYVRPLASGNRFAVLEQAGYNSDIALLRSTSSAVFGYVPKDGTETLEFQRGFVGTTWTNFNYGGSSNTRVVSIDAIEDVTVPAGTFRCFKYHKRVIGETGSDWYEWVAPGKGLVKWVDYWVDSAENPPLTYELQSAELREP